MTERDGFYVGYRPMPRGLLRKVNLAVGGVMWVLVVVAILALVAQPDPGDGTWNTATPQTRTGVLLAAPYPMVVENAHLGDGASVTLLVQMGKLGAQPMLGGRDRVSVEVEGFAIERDGRRILELVPEPEAIRASAAVGPPDVPPVRELAGNIVLVGEIMDSKCYLGAMKPGEGMGHRACAQLCIRGGIPPMLVVRDADGNRGYLLMTDAGGNAIEPGSILEHVGVPVRVTGALVRLGDLLMLRVADRGVAPI